jgi:N-acetylmuramoyl-L-alanine amidase
VDAGWTGAAAAVPSAAPIPQAESEHPAAPAVEAAKPKLIPAAIVARRKIVVDAGHGGKDPGASGRRGIMEKDIALLAAKELASLLEEEPRFEVVLTRQDDTFVELSGRTQKANETGADLFISLHCNAARNRKESGFETYFMSEHASDPEAQRLAEQENSVVELEGKSPQEIQAELLLGELAKTEFVNESSALATLVAKQVEKRVEIDNRGVKQAGFYVLRGTHAPAILFEMAFITNSKDEARLHSKRFRRQIVDGIFAGVRDYARRQGWLTAPAKGR